MANQLSQQERIASGNAFFDDLAGAGKESRHLLSIAAGGAVAGILAIASPAAAETAPIHVPITAEGQTLAGQAEKAGVDWHTINTKTPNLVHVHDDYIGCAPGQVFVNPGDNLTSLSEEYGGTVIKWASDNELADPNLIHAETCLDKPLDAEVSTYSFKPGDYPIKVSDQTKIPLNVILYEAAAAGHDEYHIPVGFKVSAVTPVEKPITYSFKPDDTPSEVAAATGISIEVIQQQIAAKGYDANSVPVGFEVTATVQAPTSGSTSGAQESATPPAVPQPTAPSPPAASPNVPAVQGGQLPTANIEAITSKNGVDDSIIEGAATYLLDEENLTPLGTAYALGNAIAESNIDSTAVGDNGAAKGDFQWQGSRQIGMPEGTYEQLSWAFDVEMPRSGNGELVVLSHDPNATAEQLEAAWTDYEGFGIEGNRFVWAGQLYMEMMTPSVAQAPVAPPAPTETIPPATAPQSEPPTAPEAPAPPEHNPMVDMSTVTIQNDGVTSVELTGRGDNVGFQIADSLADMFDAADAAGIHLGITSGYRSFDEQVELRIENGCPNVYEASPSSCDVPTAIPGTSEHNKGNAVDLNRDGQSLDDEAFQWLQANAGKYGFINLPSESWHWSTSGH